MSDLLENEIDQLQWFFIAYPKNLRIKLSFAHRTIERSLEQKIDPVDVIHFLKTNKYKHIIEDMDISTKNPATIQDTKVDRIVDFSNRQKPIDLDDIDDILNESLVPKHPSLISLNNTTQTTQRINEHLLEEYERTHDKEYLDNLVVGNMKLVCSISHRYRNYMNHDLSEEDLVQEGVFGLIEAIKRFDHSLGYSLSTYATYWIRQRITRAIINYGRVVRVPVHMVEQIRKLKKTEANLALQLDGHVPIDVICRELSISKERYHELRLVEHQFLAFTSLNQHVGSEEETELLEFVPNDRLEIISSAPKEFLDPAGLVEQKYLKEAITSLLSQLKPRERQVIEYRFGLNDGRFRTLEEVGQIFDLTRERIRQIEAKALKKLRRLSKTRNLQIS